jgi:ATP phosphoribosyltransferase
MTTETLRLAMPKGRLVQDTLRWMVQAGLLDTDEVEIGRRLVVPLPGAEARLGLPMEMLLLKNADVPTYVEHGVADLGVCGTDLLDEVRPRVLRAATLPFGSCRISIAARIDVDPAMLRRCDVLRVATKYPRTARAHFDSLGIPVELFVLGGSVELAAVLGLSDVIVDLVETGRTLDENHLHVLEDIGRTEVKVIVNRSLSRQRARAVDTLVAALGAPEAP